MRCPGSNGGSASSHSDMAQNKAASSLLAAWSYRPCSHARYEGGHERVPRRRIRKATKAPPGSTRHAVPNCYRAAGFGRKRPLTLVWGLPLPSCRYAYNRAPYRGVSFVHVIEFRTPPIHRLTAASSVTLRLGPIHLCVSAASHQLAVRARFDEPSLMHDCYQVSRPYG